MGSKSWTLPRLQHPSWQRKTFEDVVRRREKRQIITTYRRVKRSKSNAHLIDFREAFSSEQVLPPYLCDFADLVESKVESWPSLGSGTLDFTGGGEGGN